MGIHIFTNLLKIFTKVLVKFFFLNSLTVKNVFH